MMKYLPLLLLFVGCAHKQALKKYNLTIALRGKSELGIPSFEQDSIFACCDSVAYMDAATKVVAKNSVYRSFKEKNINAGDSVIGFLVLGPEGDVTQKISANFLRRVKNYIEANGDVTQLMDPNDPNDSLRKVK